MRHKVFCRVFQVCYIITMTEYCLCATYSILSGIPGVLHYYLVLCCQVILGLVYKVYIEYPPLTLPAWPRPPHTSSRTHKPTHDCLGPSSLPESTVVFHLTCLKLMGRFALQHPDFAHCCLHPVVFLFQ